MITDKDITKLKGVFATKEDLDKSELRTADSFVEVEKRFNNVENRLDTLEHKFDDLKDRMTNMEDHIIKELKTMQLELQVSVSHRREIADHEKRITRLEKAAFVN